MAKKPEKRGRGRPKGRRYGEAVRVRLAEDMLRRLDAATDDRSGAIREAVGEWLTRNGSN